MSARGLLVAGLLAAAAVAGPVPGSAATATPTFMIAGDCQEEQAFLDGDPAAVAAVLPSQYTAVPDPATGRPLVFVRTESCNAVTLGDTTAPGRMATVGVVVQTPDGMGCGSTIPVTGTVKGDMPPICNWYTLAWMASDLRVAQWLGDGTPSLPAVYAPGLTFQLGTFDLSRGGAPYHFDAPASTGAPFSMDAITRQHPGTLAIRGGYWLTAQSGTVKMAAATDSLTTGDATGTVSAPAGTVVAKLIGGTQAAYPPGLSSFDAEHWDTAIYRKQPQWSVSGETSFAGSCSAQGTVTFDPPANDTAQQLHYSYTATGTCTGTLDGQQVSNVPVALHHGGTSYGGCTQAQTSVPSLGALTFASGQVLDYSVDFETDLTQVSFILYGQRSGYAPGSGTFATTRTSPTITADCATPGVTTAPLDFSFTTQTPLASAPNTTGTTACSGTCAASRSGEQQHRTVAPTAATTAASLVGLPETGAATPGAGASLCAAGALIAAACLRRRTRGA